MVYMYYVLVFFSVAASTTYMVETIDERINKNW